MASGTYLEAPSASGMRINMRPDDASLVVVGELACYHLHARCSFQACSMLDQLC